MPDAVPVITPASGCRKYQKRPPTMRPTPRNQAMQTRPTRLSRSRVIL
jgi:hypothetical protein